MLIVLVIYFSFLFFSCSFFLLFSSVCVPFVKSVSVLWMLLWSNRCRDASNLLHHTDNEDERDVQDRHVKLVKQKERVYEIIRDWGKWSVSVLILYIFLYFKS